MDIVSEDPDAMEEHKKQCLLSTTFKNLDFLSPEGLKEYTNQCILSRSSPTPPGRIYPYESGFGDLCFLNGSDRLVRRRLKMENCYPEPRVEMLTSDDPFNLSFMHLPREVRDQIYKIVINPMCVKSESDILPFDGVHLSVWTPEKKPVRYADYPAKPDGPETAIEQKFRLLHRPFDSPIREKHPGRNYNYDISAYQSTSASLQDLDDIRNLSNTSSIIRKELAEVTFARTSIKLSEWSIDPVEQFLRDRPAAWAGIKKMSLDLSFVSSISAGTEFKLRKGLLELWKLLSIILQLESLQVHIRMREESLKVFLGLNEKPRWVEAIRKFPVNRNFEMRLEPIPDDDEDWENKEHIDALRERYESRIKEQIFPDSLKPKQKSLEEMTEVERYMATRLL